MSQQLNLRQLLLKYEPKLREAFLLAASEMRRGAQISQIVKALERGDIGKAVEALYIDRAAYRAFERLIEDAYGEGGVAGVAELGTLRDGDGARFIVRFNARNLRAEQWLRDQSSNLITEIVEEQRDAARVALTEGMVRGDNPRQVALDIAGRQNKSNGRRTGGILGLSGPQERAVTKAREELAAGDYTAFMGRKLRDKRFDRTLAKAAKDGRPLTEVQIDKIVNRYSDRSLKHRGVVIARTEALRSLNAGQHEALLQLVDTGKVRVDQIRRTWDSAGDRKVRFSHAVMDGDSVGLNEPFKSPRGALIMYPGDPSAPASETVQCRCIVRNRIDYRPNR